MNLFNMKLALRNLWRHKTFSFIHILGLSVGFTCCILIGLYTYHQYSFDRFHPEYQQIYRINKITSEKNKQSQLQCIVPGRFVPAIRANVPEVKQAALFRPWFNDMLVSHDTTRFILENVSYADEGFLEIFNFQMVNGQPALDKPFTAVLTESTAKKYFKEENPIGKTLSTLNDIQVTVTGVCRDIPENSSIDFSMLISWSSTTAPANADYFSWMNNWLTQVDYAFVKLVPGSDPVSTGTKLAEILHTNLPERKFEYLPYLQPLKDIHLRSSKILYGEAFKTNSQRVVITLLTVAFIILLIACFNFINLSTAGALGRAKETGIQKVLGARQNQLVLKFFGESFVICSFAFLVSVLASITLLPYFNILADVHLTKELLSKPSIIGGLCGLLIFMSLLAGFYPSLFLARFKSMDVFKNVIKSSKDSFARQSLVTTQFALSIALIIGTLIVHKQTRYLMTKDLGFDRDQILVLKLTNTGLENKSSQLADALKQAPGISSVSTSNRVPGQNFNGYTLIPEGHTADEHMIGRILETDADFAKTYNIKIEQGRFFSPQMPTDTVEAIVINQSMVTFLNWKEPIGKKFEIEGTRKGKVIGVIRDINTSSLREATQPLAIILKSNPLYMSVKLNKGNIQPTMEFIQRTWGQLESVHPFDYYFLDERLNTFYKSENQLMRVLTLFAGIAICIACMGLFGLSIYSVRHRIKEIGIRKVLGADNMNITLLISKGFLKLVFISILIATPLTWIVLNKWLQDFAYRVQIGWWVFILSGIVAMGIALITVSYHAIKAAMANPVKAIMNNE
ncbi:MAG: ABC transporter permease [Saprospiraceae bacterium]